MSDIELGIVILNWNEAVKTLGSIRSIKQNIRRPFVLVVVDNDSHDSSVETIDKELKKYGASYIRLKKRDMDNGVRQFNEYSIILIENDHNVGYAGGNNLGIKILNDYFNLKYYWLLNNDAFMSADAVTPMIDALTKSEDTGFVGSVLIYANTDTIQCVGGGTILPLLGKTRLIGKGLRLNNLQKVGNNRLDFIMGASLLVRKEVVDHIGLMEEGYFMYSEEADWQWRAEKKGWGRVVATDSFVYHIDAGSTRSSRHKYYYYLTRSSIMFRKRFFRTYTVLISAISVSIILIVQNITKPKNIIYGIKGVKDGLFWKWD